MTFDEHELLLPFGSSGNTVLRPLQTHQPFMNAEPGSVGRKSLSAHQP
ncbi:28698_t:CDS:2, partial [Racocetra persica]